MALPIFAITIFVSAFLLFLVQPLIGKLILPKLGGTPQVWNTCMVFFQSALLLGYAYTHSISTKLKLRQQMMLHAALLVIPIVMLVVFPIYGEVQGWSPPPGANPIVSTLTLLAMIIGVPFFVVSTSAPLLQKWFGYSGHSTAQDPYFLYSISNLGSLLSLLLYPVMIEPVTFLQDQSYIFFGGYIVLAGLILFCAFTINKLAPSDDSIMATDSAAAAAAEAATAPLPEMPVAPLETPPAPLTAPAVETAVKPGQPTGARGIQRKKGKLPAKVPGAEEKPVPQEAPPPEIVHNVDAPMNWFRRIRWVLLAAVPSSLMLGVTSYISTDMSPFPLVWVIPLALYLISFILVYDKYVQWTSKRHSLLGGRYTLQQMTVYVLQPIGLIILCYIILKGGFDPVASTVMVMLGFFANALACHGELAQDRPGTKHLTEYFLLMSFGGMVGGIFNGIIAPVVFQTGVLEYYIVIVVACMVRPQYVPVGWFDDLVLQAFPGFKGWVTNQGDEMAKSMGRPAPRSTYMFSIFLDIVLGAFILAISYWLRRKFYQTEWLVGLLKFIGAKEDPNTGLRTGFQFFRAALTMGPPLIFAFFFAGRPLRCGLAMAGIFVGALYLAEGERGVLEARRTYFGLLRVMQEAEGPRDPDERKDFTIKPIMKDGEAYAPPFPYTYLMHGTTYHGRNYQYDQDDKHIADLSRLATTYYHRYGPVGIIMERYNWFPGKQNNYAADARLPAAMVGQFAASLGVGTLPLDAIVEGWSEPPFATIGLGTGTMASYGRPYQFCTYYEIDDVMRRFSLPEEDDKTRFTYLENAIRRGVNLEVIMGDARLSLEPKREKYNKENSRAFVADFSLGAGKEPKKRPYVDVKYTHSPSNSPTRDNFYKVIVVDAFSSDAIPIHLVTKQAIQIYLDKLTEDGVLCVHTSNRHLDLVRPVARIAKELSDESVKKNGADKQIYCKIGKDRNEREFFMGHFSSEYVMIYRDKKVGDYLDDLYETHEKLVSEWAEKEGERDTRLWRAPPTRPILYSKVQWYDPYKDQKYQLRSGGTVTWHKAVTSNDSLWTDDFSHILGVVRWPEDILFWVMVGGGLFAGLLVIVIILAIKK